MEQKPQEIKSQQEEIDPKDDSDTNTHPSTHVYMVLLTLISVPNRLKQKPLARH